MLEGRFAELCRLEIQTIAQSVPAGGDSQAAMALALMAACHGLGSMGFHGAPDLDQLREEAAHLVFDRVAKR